MQTRNQNNWNEKANYALLNMATPRLVKYITATMDNIFHAHFITPLFDGYQLRIRGSEYFMSEGYQRSKEAGVAIIDPLPLGKIWRNIPFISKLANVMPSIYIFSGTAANLNAIAEYGEKNNDAKARKPHDRVKEATGATTIVNQLGEGARQEKRKIISNLSTHDAFSYARELGSNMDKFWDDNLSLQDNITYIGAKIIGKCFLGINEFPKKYISFLRKANDLIADGDASSTEFADMRTKILAMSDDILGRNADGIFNNKISYVRTQYELTGDESPKEKKDKLIESHGGAGFIVESNLSFLIMVALAHISASPHILETLQNEIRDAELKNVADLKNFKYLDCIYRETLRFSSPTAVVPRFTSERSTIKVENTNGKVTSCTIHPNAYLFFTIRPIHHDSELWQQPELFNPLRFKTAVENNEQHFIGKNFFPFSSGKRGCPAGSGFVEYAFKGFLVEFFKKYTLTLNETLECIPASAIHPRWKTEYYATIQENNCNRKSAAPAAAPHS